MLCHRQLDHFEGKLLLQIRPLGTGTLVLGKDRRRLRIRPGFNASSSRYELFGLGFLFANVANANGYMRL